MSSAVGACTVGWLPHLVAPRNLPQRGSNRNHLALRSRSFAAAYNDRPGSGLALKRNPAQAGFFRLCLGVRATLCVPSTNDHIRVQRRDPR